MNEIIGYDTIPDGRRFPVFSGPCKGCGAKNYGASTSGPDYCAACACGINPEVSQLRAKLADLQNRHLDALCALSIATGHKIDGLTGIMRDRGDRFLESFKADINHADAGPVD